MDSTPTQLKFGLHGLLPSTLSPRRVIRPEAYGRGWRQLAWCRPIQCQDSCYLQFDATETHRNTQHHAVEDSASKDGKVLSTTRYIPYLARAKQLLISSTRYIAYSSDVGESLRPVLKRWQVNLSYGIAGAYVLGETAVAGYRKKEQDCNNEVVAAACAHTALFQFAASLALPAVIIHTVVHQVQHVLDKPRFTNRPTLLRYGPSAVGLSIVPFLPLLDPPCEWVIDFLFDRWWPGWRS
mmetsp:Transcript_14367/g.29797  ORF Transcript_14367/g.29797 Transcript_14367/m.29797 type:complete len:239 (-) Transcript_14367:179-895(-)